MSNSFETQKKSHPTEHPPVGEKLKKFLSLMSDRINQEVVEKYGLKNLLNSDCSLDILAYRQQSGGIYNDQKIVQDLQKIKQQEEDFSGANDPDILQSLNISKEERVKQWKKDKAMSANGQMEMVATLLMGRILKDRFLIVRTATFDDYTHGVDNLIIDLESGQVVGAFDEVHQGGQGEDRLEIKKEKIKKIAQHGGATIDYGLSVAENKLVRSELKNVPVFYLGLHNNELTNLLKNMNYDLDAPPSTVEISTFKILLQSLKEQQQELQTQITEDNILSEKIKKFKNTIDVLETLVSDTEK